MVLAATRSMLELNGFCVKYAIVLSHLMLAHLKHASTWWLFGHQEYAGHDCPLCCVATGPGGMLLCVCVHMHTVHQ